MSQTFFKNTYSKLNDFIELQKRINSKSTFKSKLSQRLGLWNILLKIIFISKKINKIKNI